MECKLAKNVESDPKGFFKDGSSKTRTKDKVGRLTDENGETITNDSKTADILNEYFSSVFTQEILQNLPNPKQIFTGEDDDILDHVNLSRDEISKTLTVLKPEKAPGVDWIRPVVLKEVASMISLLLSWIFVRSLTGGVVPEDWHKANVLALYKEGPRNLTENNKPVSLTCQICKVMESLIRDAIVEHLKKHSLIIDSPHGFR